jgi:uncharacterized protein (DUF362 family)/sugar phosphate isomerase/epimerase
MSLNYPVAVIRATEIAPAVERGIALLGGMERFVRPGARVVIKVNMFTRATPESGKVTHPAVVLAVARLAHACGAQVTVAERVAYYDFIFQGYEEIRDVARLVTLEDVPHTHRHLPGARSLVNQVPWPTLLDECDVLINIPGLRTHALTKVSNGMKNLMGLLPDQATRLIHHHGLDGSICDINYYRPSDLVITEAIYALEGNFPSEGSPVKSDLITVADNVVAADLVAARLMHEDPAELHFLQEAIARGMGPASLDEVTLLGDDLETIADEMRITPSPRDPELHRGPFRLALGDMCDSCRQALAGGLLAVSHNPALANLQGVTIIAGHHHQPPEVGNDKVLLYGNCTYPLRHLGQYETGCPPLAFQVAEGLRALKPRTIRPSICSIAWRNDPIESILSLVARAGYLGLEAWGPHLDRFAQEQGSLIPLAQHFSASGLTVPMISAYFDMEKDPEGSLEIARRYAGYAAILQAPLIRVFTRGGDSAQASIGTWRKVVANLREVCRIGADQGLAYAIETHDGHLHDTTETTLRLIRQVGAPNLGVNLDIFNLFAIGEDPVRALKRLLPWLRIVHLKNGMREGATYRNGAPLAEGAMDYRPFLQALAEANYGGYASIEWFGPDPSGAAFSEMTFLRQVLDDKLEVQA